jgi:polysaccharide biosynthesis protein PslE
MSNNTKQITQTDTTTLRDMVMPIFRRKRLVVTSFLGIFMGAILAAFLLANYYQVDFEILVDRERLDPMVTTEQTNQPAQQAQAVTPEELNSEIELLRSPDLLEKVVLANGLQEKEQHSWTAKLFPKTEAESVAKAVKNLAAKLTIAPVEKSNNISVRYRSTDPKQAYGVMDSLANLYLEKHLTVHRPNGSLDFFTNETEKYRAALANSEAKLASFGVNAGVAAPDVVRTYMAQQVAQFEGALNQAKQAVAADEKRIKDLKSQMETTPSRSSTQETSTQAAILLQQLKTNLLAAQLKRTQLLLKFDPSYPLVQEADREIAQTQQAIAEADKNQYLTTTTDRDPTYELLRQSLAQTQADLAAQRANVAAATDSVRNIQVKMVDLDQKAVKQSDMIREVKADESNYLLYLSKREQERTLDALDKKRIANVSIAVPPVKPILPLFSPMLVVAIGFFLAIFLSTAAAFIADYLDVSFRTPAEVTNVLEMPVLASVPRRVA